MNSNTKSGGQNIIDLKRYQEMGHYCEILTRLLIAHGDPLYVASLLYHVRQHLQELPPRQGPTESQGDLDAPPDAHATEIRHIGTADERPHITDFQMECDIRQITQLLRTFPSESVSLAVGVLQALPTAPTQDRGAQGGKGGAP